MVSLAFVWRHRDAASDVNTEQTLSACLALLVALHVAFYISTIIKTTSVSVMVTVTEAVSMTGWPMHGKISNNQCGIDWGLSSSSLFTT